MNKELIETFQSFLPCEWKPEKKQLEYLEKLIHFANQHKYSISKKYDEAFIESVSQKLEVHKETYKNIIDIAFQDGVKLNYILKSNIIKLLNLRDFNGYKKLLSSQNIHSVNMLNAFKLVEVDTILNSINNIYYNDNKYYDIYCSIFSRYCLNLFPEECYYSFFSGDICHNESYHDFLSKKYPDLTNRDNALGILDVSDDLFEEGYINGCNSILKSINYLFNRLNNHCNLAIIIPSIKINNEDIQWKLFSDLILYSEKHKKEKINKSYFRWKKIGEKTLEYINNISPFLSEFEYAFQGFVFKDCFVLGNQNSDYSLLIILEKNVRDERVLNCPACRSINIQGNSYPILNVKSWECKNPLCPERTKYNRGKRYSFISLFRQKEIMNDENIIPNESISMWRLDCLFNVNKENVLDMIIRHYSFVGDGVLYISTKEWEGESYKRKISHIKFSTPKNNLLLDFKGSSYFYRYLQYNDKVNYNFDKLCCGNYCLYNGDAIDVLRNLPKESINGVVTSPPYYNAKAYSKWENIYCYLYDMYNINTEIYRVMKDGAVLLYNIFDYFDNENNIALSAMGNKRMILGAYMIDIFERIGFKIIGNIIWNKGEVQGNRNFNQGNHSPYYQAPLNCWEHVFILSKGNPNKKFESLTSSIKNIKPVIKIIKGKNILGHSAPYPNEIPYLLINCLNSNDTVLDPFLGSGTTCIVANNSNVKSVGIEKSEKYFELSKELISSNS